MNDQTKQAPESEVEPIKPYYQCHGIVQAVRITKVEIYHNRVLLQYVQEGVHWIDITLDWLRQFNPQAGDYYVLFATGDAITANAAAFEQNYKPLGDVGIGFDEALEFMRHGKQVARHEWNYGNTAAPIFIFIDHDVRENDLGFCLHDADGALCDAKLRAPDLLARDWYLVS